MHATEATELPKQDSTSSPKALALRTSMRKFEPLLAPSFVFTLAFFLRYLYNAVFMEHRIAHFGDAYNFLRSGSALLQAAAASQNIAEFFAKIYQPAEPHVQLLQSMTSMNLTDRLLIDGPVFPAYLAIVEWITGVTASNPIFDAHSVQICLCNSLVDALACVLVYFSARLAFERRTALLAGIMFACYPAAIINTQHCYSEPFSYFLLNVWTTLVLFVLLRHQGKNKLAQLSSWVGIGLFSGLLMLSKPAFIMLPPMVVVVFATISILRLVKSGNGRDKLIAQGLQTIKKYLRNAAIAFVGLAVVLTPWMFFNKAASGQYSVFVNRVPSFNIFHGNQIGTDAWRCYPFYGTFPGDSQHVIASLIVDAKQDPITFVGLQFKKVARLWAGEWNEYHYSLFGVSLDIQNLYHQLFLLLGAVALAYFLFRSKHKTLSREFSATCLFATIVLFHFAYIPFEAISRYAITAMPAIITLVAALVISVNKSSAARKVLVSLVVLSAFCFYLLSQSGATASFVAGLLPLSSICLAPYAAALIGMICLAASFAVCAKLLALLIADKRTLRSSLSIPVALFLLAGTVASVYTIQSHDWMEWSSSLIPGKPIVQTILVPPNIPSVSKNSFVLVDLGSRTLAAPIQVRLNGKTLNDPLIPLAQLQPNNNDILQCLAIQAEGMSIDVRGFRNWWVLPFPTSYIKPGQSNVLELSVLDKDAEVIVYGDYKTSVSLDETKDGVVYLPSLRSFSYTKGFTTFDHRDPRVFEKVEINGKTVSSADDLSNAFGKQTGTYRIRLLVPVTAAGAAGTAENLTRSSSLANAVLDPSGSTISISSKAQLLNGLPILFQQQPLKVEGKNPVSFIPPVQKIILPDNLGSGVRFNFSCETRSLSGKRPCFITLNFIGMDANQQQQSWTSKWQPIGIENTKVFKVTSFSDVIPDEISALKHLEIRPMVSPFQPDYLFLKKRDALRSTIEIRDSKILFFPALDLPSAEARTWLVY